MRNFFIVITFVFACITVASAQESANAGVLIVEGNIENAYIKIENNRSELIRNARWSKQLSSGSYSYEISRIGYEIERGAFTIRPGENTILKVNLVSLDGETAIVPEKDFKDLKVSTTQKPKSGAPLIITGTTLILAGIAATALLPKHFTEEKDGYRITGREFNLLYAVGGLAAGGVCIGKGISMNKKKKQATALQPLAQPANDSYARLNMVASANTFGFRITF